MDRPFETPSRGAETVLFEARGMRGRPVQVVATQLVLMVMPLAAMNWTIGQSRGLRWVTLACVVPAFGMALWRMAQRRIVLFADRVVVDSWNPYSARGTRVLALRDLYRVSWIGTSLRLFQRGTPPTCQVTLNVSAAEDLLDLILEQLATMPDRRLRQTYESELRRTVSVDPISAAPQAS
ncbi:MAG: hypothetical protein KDC87_14040 [Planctomycetes bacterium]|nr:hypothetical protein [Planctomycetota bacterium]MCB9872253.1 hypothetical protein [Planctomycetota bacterium]